MEKRALKRTLWQMLSSCEDIHWFSADHAMQHHCRALNIDIIWSIACVHCNYIFPAKHENLSWCMSILSIKYFTKSFSLTFARSFPQINSRRSYTVDEMVFFLMFYISVLLSLCFSHRPLLCKHLAFLLSCFPHARTTYPYTSALWQLTPAHSTLPSPVSSSLCLLCWYFSANVLQLHENTIHIFTPAGKQHTEKVHCVCQNL